MTNGRNFDETPDSASRRQRAVSLSSARVPAFVTAKYLASRLFSVFCQEPLIHPFCSSLTSAG